MICCDRDLGQNRDTCFFGGLLFCEQSDIISIREVLLVMLYRLESSLYQVDSLAAHSDNQHVTETLNTFKSNFDVVCTKSLEAWRDIQMLDAVAKAIRVMNVSSNFVSADFGIITISSFQKLRISRFRKS